MIRQVSLALTVAATIAASTTAHATDKVNYIISWLPTGEEAYPYVGVQQGYFKAEGIELNILIGRGSIDSISKITAGTADFGDIAIGALMGATVESHVPIKGLL
jgi:NitT/TauT family transport system substrate-binding protein